MYDAAFLERLADGLRRALPRWDLPADARLDLLTVSENATFRAAGPGGADLVFRVHRPGYHSRAEIASELAWIAALRAEEIVPTPRPVPLRDGSLIADIDDAGIPRQVVAFEFVAGREPDERDDLVAWFEVLGAIHARLHQHARTWARPAGFARKVWNFDTMLGRTPLWGDWRAALGLDAAGAAVLARAVAALAHDLRAAGTGPDAFGLIHADLRLANLLVAGDRLALIDFDDCGFSWFLYDFAAAVSFIEHTPIVPDLCAAWVAGYRTRLPLSDAAAAQLPMFVMLRRILLTAWIASHAETPTAQGLGTGYTAGTVEMAEAYLARRPQPVEAGG
ncbi:phosphotransferase enzyme family protein [Aquabacter spiritensis]|uniref:Ser/Thr protein kinase RdoA (MazF antagonist) n=1 Tax=Aquabacter spiritensis TaxID=933073 RepID=A0A4R3LY65_9HYPH|nr:phosphotransferase [Aquabacter spiritensis]TCT05602.1 Ser/Thr protein kinase RdoA (MazF antagonist) [Aquabacter spiritensis]